MTSHTIIQPPGDVDGLVYTTAGYVHPDTLSKAVHTDDYVDAVVTTTTYTLDGLVVKQDVDIALKSKDMLAYAQGGC